MNYTLISTNEYTNEVKLFNFICILLVICLFNLICYLIIPKIQQLCCLYKPPIIY